MRNRHRVRIFLSLQRALIGNVTDKVRGVTCDWKNLKLHIKFIFYDEPSCDEIEQAEVIVTEVAADMENYSVYSTYTVVLKNSPVRSQILKHWVYLRSE